MASTKSAMEVYGPGSRLYFVVDFESFSSKNLNFFSVIYWYIDGLDISEIATSHCPSKFSCSGKKFVKELRVLSGNNSPEALETNSTVNPMLNEFHQLFLIKFTLNNLALLILDCVCWWFSCCNCYTFKNFSCKLRLVTFAKRQVIL